MMFFTTLKNANNMISLDLMLLAEDLEQAVSMQVDFQWMTFSLCLAMFLVDMEDLVDLVEVAPKGVKTEGAIYA